MEICPQIFHLDPIANNTAEVPSFTLRTALSAIPLVSDRLWCRRAMIPGEIFTSFAEFQGIVSINDFWFPLGFPGTFASFFVFSWEVFVLHGKTPGSIEWLDSCTTDLLIGDCFRDSQVTLRNLVILLSSSHQNFAARGYGFRHCVLLHGALVIFGPLTDLAIFRSLGKWV